MVSILPSLTNVHPNRGPFSLSENPFDCVEASFFTLPLGLCCQRAALRKSLFLPGRASCVPPPSPSVLMAVPPTCWDPDPSRGRASAGDNYCCSPALIIWPHGSITADHMFQETRRRSKERKEEELEWGAKKKRNPFSFKLSPKFYSTLEASRRVSQNGQICVSHSSPLMVIIYLHQGNHTYYRLCLAAASNEVQFQFASQSFVSAAVWERIILRQL